MAKKRNKAKRKAKKKLKDPNPRNPYVEATIVRKTGPMKDKRLKRKTRKTWKKDLT